MGKLYGIGVGPGDPELLTLKAYRILNQVDVIFCPEKEAGAGSLAYDIIKELIKESKAEVVNLVYPMHYHGEKLRKMWQINADFIAKRLEGEQNGAFITLGDPSVYSTFMYILPYIENTGIEVQAVPGITSFCAAANSMNIPLAAWNQNLVIAPVRKNSREYLKKLIKDHDNVVLMKPSADQQAIVELIQENNLEDSFALMTKAGTDEEQMITDFTELKQYDIPYLSTIIIKNKGR